ncbi:tRNA (adenosine(37)-N6)-threonylcarbamoyltransferase complex dimerization subunit type 1 TsaB [Nocardioides panacisoli]|uniref:tRNA (adenosine(37)-N6)-threonylcarbamoyltransferase complex dimerization subunit type 1 TsaB n=1 Tax=Nocardioides panacisoli TaxID=627624 RepID=UPI001C6260AD|nr:tRNA (adenosine(37)-N6)-threonylcarbamoyltransferase complex dimerization subunit type 1 TsaB [Nocardioides panacisoli]QYJ02583.1 tRNA (adenosine(37)-N6)-threonylcarbamoyltransferase complex dimerization subunit type 1 TsaB [Nocardioides panacisoli]
MLLAFDTSSPTVTAALHDGTDVVAEEVSQQPMKHGEQLMPTIQRVLDAVGVVPRDLTALAVGVGPGPFTGLRVGLVTARTLAHTLDVPVYGVCSLDVLAVQAIDTGAVPEEFVVATDARRREVYVATYADGVRTGGPEVRKPVDVATQAPVVGEGATLYPDQFPDGREPLRPSAGWLARTVAEERAPLTDPEPLYLRRPDTAAPRPPKQVS